MLKRFLKSGFMPFIAGIAVITAYSFISPPVLGCPSGSRSLPVVFNFLFSGLFVLSCCIAAFFYGKNKNKSGLLGLLCIFALYFISLIFAFIPIASLPQVIQMPVLLTFLLFLNIFTPFDIYSMFYIPLILIILIIVSWYIGYRKGGHANKYEI